MCNMIYKSKVFRFINFIIIIIKKKNGYKPFCETFCMLVLMTSDNLENSANPPLIENTYICIKIYYTIHKTKYITIKQ